MEAAPSLPGGFRLARFGQLDSTNAEALRRLGQADAVGTAILAESQNAGRGRQGRSWASPPGNLHLSLIVAPPPARPSAELALVAGVALAEAVGEHMPAGVRPGLKWPNDLMIDGRKAGGILIETGFAPGGVLVAVIGVGVNLASAPEGIATPVTSLKEAGGTVLPMELLPGFCAAFDAWFGRWTRQGLAPVRANWLASAERLGEEVMAHTPTGTVRGSFVGLDAGGGLLLRESGGRRRRIDVADVLFVAE